MVQWEPVRAVRERQSVGRKAEVAQGSWGWEEQAGTASCRSWEPLPDGQAGSPRLDVATDKTFS